MSITETAPSGTDGLMDYFIMEWINIKDKLPKPYEKVLVYFGGGDLESIAVRYLPEERPGQYYGWYPGGQALHNATHWMPLPPPPGDGDT